VILLAVNKDRRLLYQRHVGKVTASDLRNHEEELRRVVADLGAGFRMLTDLADLEAMGEDCGAELGRIMDFLKAAGLEMVVRIIPDPRKDIGLNILSVFHYGRSVRTVTCKDIAEAMHTLKL
jgi:hypothetical protein